MTAWDPDACDALRQCAERLAECRVSAWLHQVTAEMWRVNADRYEPTDLHDTARGIAGLAVENLRERLLADYRLSAEAWRQQGVRLSVPHGSLLIEAPPFRLHLVKARGMSLRDPDWAAFDWAASATRAAAAARNSGQSTAAPSSATLDGQLTIPELAQQPPSSGVEPTVLREAFLVWAGDVEGRTAGWLGLPALSRQRWLAVQSLWRDTTARTTLDEAATSPAGQAFDARPEPATPVTLKQQAVRPAR